jgi:hypothetical protein
MKPHYLSREQEARNILSYLRRLYETETEPEQAEDWRAKLPQTEAVED